jgi:hypothetical protein
MEAKIFLYVASEWWGWTGKCLYVEVKSGVGEISGVPEERSSEQT